MSARHGSSCTAVAALPRFLLSAWRPPAAATTAHPRPGRDRAECTSGPVIVAARRHAAHTGGRRWVWRGGCRRRAPPPPFCPSPRYRRRVPLSHRHFVTFSNSHAFPEAPSPSGRLGVHLRAQRRRRPRSVMASWPSFAASCFWQPSGRVQNNKQMSPVSSSYFLFLRSFNPTYLRHAWSSRETGHIKV